MKPGVWESILYLSYKTPIKSASDHSEGKVDKVPLAEGLGQSITTKSPKFVVLIDHLGYVSDPFRPAGLAHVTGGSIDGGRQVIEGFSRPNANVVKAACDHYLFLFLRR